VTGAVGFTALDAVVLVLYLIGTTALGVWLGRNQKDARDYFVAGKTIPWWAILFSVVATETSALTFISIPGLAYIGNLGFLQVAAGYLLGRIVISMTLLPRYYQGELVTAYTLLERRFGLATRRFASIVFMFTRIFGDSVRVFATAIPLALILGTLIDARFVGPVAILTLGFFTVIYTYKGGMRAVVWTDVIQMGVYMLGGLGAVYLIGQGIDGGWGTVVSRVSAEAKLSLINTSFVLSDPHTIWAGLIGGGFLSMASHGADQLIVQRLLAARSLADSRKALIGSGVVVLLQFALFLFIGLGLYVFYSAEEFASPDSIFPRFIIEVMPPGMTGIVIAAILAAAMSTISSSLNALAAASTHDIYLPLRKREISQVELLKVARKLTLFWAVIVIGGAMLYREQGTPVVVIALSIASFTYGGLLGAFSLALLWPRARQRDALTGMAVGISAMILVVFARRLADSFAFMEWLAPFAGIAWPWYVLIGTTITLSVGIVSSLIGKRTAT
jgi:solute:Na+ symporter, SSS family